MSQISSTPAPVKDDAADEIAALMARARAAQQAIDHYSQE